MAELRIGTVEDGYVYVGGDPKRQRSWAPVSEMRGFMQEAPTFTESVGRGAMDLAQGIKQGFLQAFSPERAKEYTREVQDEIGLYERGQSGLDVGRLVGNVAGTVPAGLLAGGAPVASILRAGLAGGAAGGAQFVPEGDSRLSNATVGGILGAGLQSVPAGVRMLKEAAKPSATMASAAAKAQQMGVSPTPAQATGSRTLQRIEAGLENTAGGGLAMEQLSRSNMRSLVRSIAGKFGLDTDTLDRTMLGKAHDAMQGKFSSALSGKKIAPDNQFLAELAKVTDDFSGPGVKLPTAIREAIDDPRFLQSMTAEQYQRARSLYGKHAVDAFRGGRSTEGKAWEALQEAVDSLAERALPKDAGKTLGEARQMSRMLHTLEKAVDPHTGNVSGPRLVNAIRQNDPKGFFYGKGTHPLGDIGDVSNFMRFAPDSFTASRMGMMGAPSILGGAYGAVDGGWEGAAKGAAIGTALPYVAARGYLGLTRPGGILGSVGQGGLNYAIPAIGGLLAQP